MALEILKYVRFVERYYLLTTSETLKFTCKHKTNYNTHSGKSFFWLKFQCGWYTKIDLVNFREVVGIRIWAVT